MPDYAFSHADKSQFAAYNTVYTETDIHADFDWNGRVSDLEENENGIFILRGDNIVAGFTLDGNNLSHPFMVPPFCDRAEFWRLALGYAAERGNTEINLKLIAKADEEMLTEAFGARLKWSQRRMLRPTDKTYAAPPDSFIFTTPEQKDIPEVVDVVYLAHSAGYTSTVWEISRVSTEESINRRFELFAKTNTLHFGVLARSAADDKLAGVCIAGIYPDSANGFSTINQVSVLPEYRGRGIAGAMMMRSIGIAHSISPVITLGVLIGNPAERLYKKLGFAPMPPYSELVCRV